MSPTSAGELGESLFDEEEWYAHSYQHKGVGYKKSSTPIGKCSIRESPHVTIPDAIAHSR